jgi:hypothetical protein
MTLEINGITREMDFGDAIEECQMLVSLGRAIPAEDWLGVGTTKQNFEWMSNYG